MKPEEHVTEMKVGKTGVSMDRNKKEPGFGKVQELDHPDRVKYLSIIDSFRELNVNNSVSLPQLCVVGDQSSGKSSLLEGITGLPFPVASELCTRFATQLILRRSSARDAGAKVTIIPGSSSQSDEAQQAHLKSFARTLDDAELDGQQLGEIIEQASLHMGLPSALRNGQGGSSETCEKRFSDDILKIEVSGPHHQHLSIVDVPGLFHNPTQFQTEEDRQIIRKLIQSYIGDKRTIIIAVMDATSNLANQEVFQLARQADAGGKRTVGVITKLDLVPEGDEGSVLDIANNKTEPLSHGWYVVKNRSTKDIRDGVSLAQRNEKEKMFLAKSPWTALERRRCGVGNLTSYLGHQLYEHIRAEFPSLIENLEDIYKKTKSKLNELGVPRKTSIEQRQFLISAANAYQMATRDALAGNYSPDLPKKSPLKLRKIIRDLNDSFAADIQNFGALYPFVDAEDTFDSTQKEDTRTMARQTDSGYGSPDEEIDGKPSTIFDWIREEYRDSRGAELPGCINPALVESLFRQQSAGWVEITHVYFEMLLELITSYNESQLELVVPEDSVRRRLMARLYTSIQDAVQVGREEMEASLGDERGGILQTVNHYLADVIEQEQTKRVVARLRQSGIVDENDKIKANVNMESILVTTNLNNEDQSVYMIHDVLKAYYELAMKRFMDKIIMSVGERHLLGSRGTVKAFSPEFATLLTDEELEDIASENLSTTLARAECQQRLEGLSKALEMARGL